MAITALPTGPTRTPFDPERLTALLYGHPKIGRTTFCAQIPSALFIATEPGQAHVTCAKVDVASWADFLDACKLIKAGGHPYRTIVIDVVDKLWEMCAASICAKNNVTHESDLSYGKGTSLITAEFQRTISFLCQLGYGVWFVSHVEQREFDTQTGKVQMWVPGMARKCFQVVNRIVDVVAFADIEREMVDRVKEPGAVNVELHRRVLRLTPGKYHVAGNRFGKLPDTVPLDYNAFRSALIKVVEGDGETKPTTKTKE